MQDSWRAIQATEGVISLPEYISPAFQRLIDNTADADESKRLLRQVTACKDESIICGSETADPLGEARYCITPYLVHQYPNRVLLLSTGRCISYCRYCFRREFTARATDFLTNSEIQIVVDYLHKTPAVQEILVSGGDPMSGTFEQLHNLLTRLRAVREDLLIRLCTRAAIFAPQLFSSHMISLLQSVRPLWMIAHINHPAELGEEQKKALSACINAGIPVQSQTVLLHRINDSAAILARLFHRLVCLGVKPGYLFQADLARGTGCFRVPLERSCEIWKVLRTMLSGLSLPQFAVDLPGGGGKFPLSALILRDDIITPLNNNTFSARGQDGHMYTYGSTNTV